jgi:hypothetical protein
MVTLGSTIFGEITVSMMTLDKVIPQSWSKHYHICQIGRHFRHRTLSGERLGYVMLQGRHRQQQYVLSLDGKIGSGQDIVQGTFSQIRARDIA